MCFAGCGPCGRPHPERQKMKSGESHDAVVWGGHDATRLHIVVNRYNLNYAISQYRHAILNSSQVNWIVNAIEKHYTIASKQEIKRHKYNVHNRQYRAKTSIKQGVCPQCGGQLVLRHGRYGSFYGCDNYPKCKFTLNKWDEILTLLRISVISNHLKLRS